MDKKKGNMINKHCFAIRKSVTLGGGSTDPKVNGKLADALAAANKANVPRATIDRTLEKARNTALRKELLEIMGPGGSYILLDIETDNISRTRHDLKKTLRKVKGSVCGILVPGAAKHAFEEKGVIRIMKKVGEEVISFEKMEETAIEVGAEEVKEDEDDSDVWTLLTAPLDVNTVRTCLEKMLPGVEILEADSKYLPIVQVPLSEEDMEKAAALCSTFQEMDEVNNIFDNIK